MASYYSQLKDFMGLRFDDSAEESYFQSTEQRLNSLREAISTYRSRPGFSGQTAQAALTWINEFDERLQEHQRVVGVLKSSHTQARAQMVAVKTAGEQLPTQLVSSGERNVFMAEQEIVVGGYSMTGTAYLAQLERQRYQEREAEAKRILGELGKIAPPDPTPVPPSDSLETPNSSAGYVPRRSSPTPSPSNLGGSIITNRPPAPGPTAPPMWEVPKDGPGSRGNPITDPSKLEHLPLTDLPVNPRMTPEGPVGGYLPPKITDPDNPAWRPEYQVPGFSTDTSGGVSKAGVMVGGIVGAGASILAARSASAGLSGLSLTGGMGGAGAAGLAGRVPGTGMIGGLSGASGTASGTLGAAGRGGMGAGMGQGMMPGAPGANGAAGPRGGAGGAMRAGGVARGGMMSPSSAGSAGAGGSASAGGRGMMSGAPGAPGNAGAASARAAGSAGGGQGRPGMGMPGTAGQDAKRDTKKRSGLVGYDVMRIDEGDAVGVVDPSSTSSGSAANLKPVHDSDGDDSW